MINKILISGFVLASMSATSFASTAAPEFYVAQDAKTHKCMVMDKKPDGKSMTDVGTKAYATKGDADNAMSKLKACKA